MSCLSFEYIFLGGFPPNTNADMASGYGTVFGRPAPATGSIVGLVIQSDKTVNAGQITAVPTIAGIPIAGALLVSISAGFDFDCKDIPEGTPGYEFLLSNKLGIQLSSDENWNNDNGNIIAHLYISI